MKAQIEEILNKNQLSVTGSRKRILELFLMSNGALVHGDIEKKTGEKFDRVTVYRTLQTFLEKGIIHSIPTSDNLVLYALCKDDCSEGHHHDKHVHFICNKCGITFCLADVTVPEVKIPGGFLPLECQMVVTGLCADCR
jgi:Fur family transcriptional regulator, ferric uptake regulator